QFPLPVIAGIGHERDETIVDRVAHIRVKTPTAAAAYLIECFQEQENELLSLQHDFMLGVKEVLGRERQRQLLVATEFKRSVQAVLSGNVTRLKLLSRGVEHASETYVRNRRHDFEQLKNRLGAKVSLLSEKQKNRLVLLGGVVRQEVRRMLAEQGRKLELADNTVRLVDPRKVLARGYSITRFKGKAIKGIEALRPGDCLETETAGGIVRSEVRQ
ncbi:MAG: exodeoxyribonuclease VII large subunit, partial [Odoribacter sp.]|nr:exodeoxyribonuclease VII large subunit [Odoribacter sp.]